MIADEQLEQFLSAGGYRWQPIDAKQHQALCNEWDSIYSGRFTERARYRHGAKAEHEYAQQSAHQFNIVPFLGKTAGPHGIGRASPRVMAYACAGDGALPSLSPFANLDFFIAPPDLAWTMLHTHEDYALGGPYFPRREH